MSRELSRSRPPKFAIHTALAVASCANLIRIKISASSAYRAARFLDLRNHGTPKHGPPGHTLNPHQTVSNPFLERSKLHKVYLGFHHLPEGASAITLRLRDMLCSGKGQMPGSPIAPWVTSIITRYLAKDSGLRMFRSTFGAERSCCRSRFSSTSQPKPVTKASHNCGFPRSKSAVANSSL